MYAEGSRIIEECILNPITGAKLNTESKQNLRAFWDSLIVLSCKRGFSYRSKKWKRIIEVSVGEVRLSYVMIAQRNDTCRRTSLEYTRILERLGLLSRRREDLYAGTTKAKKKARPHDFKIIMVNFDLLDSFYERNSFLDPELDRINRQPDYFPHHQTDLESIIESGLEPVFDEPRLYDGSICTLPEEQNVSENETSAVESCPHDSLESNKSILHTEYDMQSDSTCNECHDSDVALQSEIPLITPAIESAWNVLVCDGGVARELILLKQNAKWKNECSSDKQVQFLRPQHYQIRQQGTGTLINNGHDWIKLTKGLAHSLINKEINKFQTVHA